MSCNGTFISQEALMLGNRIPKYNYFSNLFIFGGCQRQVFFSCQTTTKLRCREQVIVHMTLDLWNGWLQDVFIDFFHYRSKGQKNRGYANSSQVTIRSMHFQSLIQMIVDFFRKQREDTAQLCEIT